MVFSGVHGMVGGWRKFTGGSTAPNFLSEVSEGVSCNHQDRVVTSQCSCSIALECQSFHPISLNSSTMLGAHLVLLSSLCLRQSFLSYALFFKNPLSAMFFFFLSTQLNPSTSCEFKSRMKPLLTPVVSHSDYLHISVDVMPVFITYLVSFSCHSKQD